MKIIILTEIMAVCDAKFLVKGNDAEDLERCCGSKGDTIQVRNPHL